MRIIDNRGLLLRLHNPARITTAIPTSKAIGEYEVLVKWGVDEARVLRNLNIRDGINRLTTRKQLLPL